MRSIEPEQKWRSPRARVLSADVRPIGGIDAKRTRQVQIQGRARARGIVVCPLTSKPVIGYRIRIEAFVSPSLLGFDAVPTAREAGGVWHTVVETTLLQEFEVYDDSGSAFVHWLGPLLLAEPLDPSTLAVPLTRAEFYESIKADRARVGRLLGVDPEDGRYAAQAALAGNDRVRCWATTIEHNSDVFICGRPLVRLNPHGEAAGYRQAPNPLLLRSTGGHPLLLANCTKEALVETLHTRLTD